MLLIDPEEEQLIPFRGEDGQLIVVGGSQIMPINQDNNSSILKGTLNNVAADAAFHTVVTKSVSSIPKFIKIYGHAMQFNPGVITLRCALSDDRTVSLDLNLGQGGSFDVDLFDALLLNSNYTFGIAKYSSDQVDEVIGSSAESVVRNVNITVSVKVTDATNGIAAYIWVMI